MWNSNWINCLVSVATMKQQALDKLDTDTLKFCLYRLFNASRDYYMLKEVGKTMLIENPNTEIQRQVRSELFASLLDITITVREKEQK